MLGMRSPETGGDVLQTSRRWYEDEYVPGLLCEDDEGDPALVEGVSVNFIPLLLLLLIALAVAALIIRS